jgi:hypothetical protein
VTLTANRMPKIRGIEFLAGSIPLLTLGGAIGLVAAFLFGLFLFKDRPALAQAEVEKKYIGRGGLWRIYIGCPMFFFVVLLMTMGEKLARIVGERALPYVSLLVFMVIVGISLYLYDRVPRSLILPIGLLGWMLLIGFGCWYCWFGPGAFGH